MNRKMAQIPWLWLKSKLNEWGYSSRNVSTCISGQSESDWTEHLLSRGAYLIPEINIELFPTATGFRQSVKKITSKCLFFFRCIKTIIWPLTTGKYKTVLLRDSKSKRRTTCSVADTELVTRGRDVGAPPPLWVCGGRGREPLTEPHGMAGARAPVWSTTVWWGPCVGPPSLR